MKLGTVISAFFFFFPWFCVVSRFQPVFSALICPPFLSVLSLCHGMLDVLTTSECGQAGLVGVAL